MTDLRQAAQQLVERIDLEGASPLDWHEYTALRAALENEFNPDWDLLKATQESLRKHMAEIQRLRAALTEQEQEPVAWRTFDGEGGYEYRSYDMNEQYAQEWEQRNPKHKGWVEPLYTAASPCPTCEALARAVMMDQTGTDA